MANRQADDEIRRSREVAEASRETEWTEPASCASSSSATSGSTSSTRTRWRSERPEFTRFYAAFEAFLRDEVDPVAIDETGEYPPHVIDGLRKLGAFGMKIPAEYGGLGFTPGRVRPR